MKRHRVFLCAVALLFVGAFASAQEKAAAQKEVQDAVKADPKHYKVEFENDDVRVLRVNYGPLEKSIMHSHPDHLFILLTDGSIKFTLPDGKTDQRQWNSGQVGFVDADVHNPENLSDKPFEGILVELKRSKAAKSE